MFGCDMLRDQNKAVLSPSAKSPTSNQALSKFENSVQFGAFSALNLNKKSKREQTYFRDGAKESPCYSPAVFDQLKDIN